MKKSLFFYAAAAALMLTACSSEDDILQTGQTKKAVPQEVGFDVYTPSVTTTRAGLQGTMTTSRLQRSEAYGGGFGVYAYQVQDADNTATATPYNPSSPGVPNFMVNEKLLWNTVNQGWYYNPLKYWPNETGNDSQATPAEMEGPSPISTGYSHIDRLSFFAYAPYVTVGGKLTNPGISYITDKEGKLNSKADGTGSTISYDTNEGEPRIAYKTALDNPDEAVDLLWGVAPAGGLTYTAVNGKTVNVKEGMPLVDMTKPDVNTNMKFLFQHALARIGIKAVAAVDQVGAGGKLDPNTKITIEKIKLRGYFGDFGILNLDNSLPSVANWTNISGINLETTTDLSALKEVELTLVADHTVGDGETNIKKGTIARHLQWVDADGAFAINNPEKQVNRIGVTTVRQDVIQPSTVKHCVSSIEGTAENPLYYSESTPYYTTWSRDDGVSNLAKADYFKGTYYKYGQNGSWQRVKYDETDKSPQYQYPEVVQEYVATIEDGAASAFTAIDTGNEAQYSTYTAYIKSGSVFIPVADVPKAGKEHYVLTATMTKVKPVYANGTYYKRDANYFMVVPTNNISNISSTIAANPTDVEKLRTVTVTIEYYITTEDGKLNAERAQTKNVITKEVVFPSLANGKSYNLNLILGLTSVKMEAEVDDWKVINVQGDLPQNTAD